MVGVIALILSIISLVVVGYMMYCKIFNKETSPAQQVVLPPARIREDVYSEPVFVGKSKTEPKTRPKPKIAKIPPPTQQPTSVETKPEPEPEQTGPVDYTLVKDLRLQ